MEIGESLVGSYFRYVRGCEIVIYNTFLEKQGELDIVAIRNEPRTVWFCEVTTHISGGGMLIVGPDRSNATIEKIRNKLVRAREFADQTFPGEKHQFEVWSPRVPVGKTTKAFKQIREEFDQSGESLEFIMNEDYTERMRELAHHASENTSATNEPAYRALQILTHLKGGKLSL